MYEYVYLLSRESEQPVRLDDLEALVDHGGRIDRYLRAHAPIGVTKCLFDRHLAEPLFRSVQERASRSGQDEPAGGGC